MPNALIYATTVLIWGSTWYVITLQIGAVPLEMSVAYRFALAALVLLAYAALRGRRLGFGGRAHLRMAVQGLLNFGCTYTLVYLSAQYLTSGLIAVANSNVVFLNILFGALWFGQALKARVALGAAVGFGGMALIFAPDIARVDLSGDTVLGLALALGSTVTTSLGNLIAGSNQRAGIPVLQGTGFAMAYGAAVVFVVALAQGHGPAIEWTARYLGSLAYLALFGSVIAFAGYCTLLGRIGADRAAYSMVLFPVVALAISTVLEDYAWTVEALAGVALVLLGNLLVIARLRRRKAVAAQGARRVADCRPLPRGEG